MKASMLIVIPLLVFFSVWFPEIAHYHVKTVSVSNEEIEALKSTPSDAVMQELTALSLGLSVDVSDSQLVRLADMILEGKLSLPGYDTVLIHLPFDSGDLDQGLPTWQLMFASLVAPEILIEAYHITRKKRYFDLAREMILAWAEYEKSKWLPTGFLWNDHAIAARATVLSKFWRIYRAYDDFKLDEARLVLQFVFRNGEMLAKAEHFTAATNHGVMQNVALLNIATVFPVLPQAKKYLQIAYERLQDQMAFYINDEGVVLEHSAGYHELGVILIGKALQYLALNGITPPTDWIEKHEKGKRFLAKIRRPDETLPLFGNTLSKSLYAEPLRISVNDMRETLYPVSGFSVWWLAYEQALSRYPYSQTILAWSHFPGHGHKLADEMSVLIWADGQDWITNTGYWPYGILGREQVNSWEGSNAPHLVGESKNSSRKTHVLGYHTDHDLAISHLRRTGPDGYVAERQVIQAAADLWIVIDYTTDLLPRNTTTTWTFASDLITENGNWPGQIIVSKPAFPCMSASYTGSEETLPKRYKASTEPFAGWVVAENNQPKAAQSVIIEHSSNNSWSMAVFLLGRDCKEKMIDQPRMIHWGSPESWDLVLNMQGGEIKFERRGSSFSVLNAANNVRTVELAPLDPAEVTRAQNKITSVFDKVTEKYPRYNPDLIFYRIKISYVLFAVLVAQILFFFLYTKAKLPFRSHVQILSSVLWVVLGSYLYFVYFKT